MRTPKIRRVERSTRKASSRVRGGSQLRRVTGEKPGCVCGEPGHFNSGVPGIVAHVEDEIILSKEERCDTCRRYRSDVEARLALLRRGFRARYSRSFELFIYCRKCGNTGGPDPEGFRLSAWDRDLAMTRGRGGVVVECEACGSRQALPADQSSRRVQ